MMNSWNKTKINFPPQNKHLIVFRVNKKKYIVAKCITIEEEYNELGDHVYVPSWVTEYGLAHQMFPDDLWMELSPVHVEMIYE